MPMMSLDSITVDDRYQIRERQSTDMIARYTEAIEAGVSMPPVLVWQSEGVNYLIDGFHRVRAYESAGVRQVQVQIFEGDRLQAMQKAVEANLAHGLGMGQRDLRRAAKILLTQARQQGVQVSQSEYATRFGVSRTTVARWIDQIDGVAAPAPEPDPLDDMPDLDAVASTPEPDPMPEDATATDADDTLPTVPDRKLAGTARMVAEISDAQIQFQSLVRQMSKINSTVAELSNSPFGVGIGREMKRVDEAYRTMREILSAAMPRGLCTFCGGDKCKKCSNRGWMTEDEYRNASV